MTAMTQKIARNSLLTELLIWAKNCSPSTHTSDVKWALIILHEHNEPFLIGTAKEVGRGAETETDYIWCMLPSLSGNKPMLYPLINL